jgi:hypothetical protein
MQVISYIPRLQLCLTAGLIKDKKSNWKEIRTWVSVTFAKIMACKPVSRDIKLTPILAAESRCA